MKTESRTQRRKENQKKRSGGVLLFLFIILLLLTGFTGGKMYVDRNISIDTFYQGIEIDGISVEGMTKDEAIDQLTRLNQPRLDQYAIELDYGDKKWTFDYKDIDGEINIHEIVEEAYTVGRQGKLIERVKEVWNLKENSVRFETDLTYDADLLTEKINAIADELYIPAQDATITFYPDKGEKFVIENEKSGLRLDADEVMNSIRQQIVDNPNVKVNLELDEVEPEVFAADLKKQTNKIVTYSTNIATSSDNRKHNVILALRQFNGMVVKPGEEVSFNETTGERSKANGYKAAPVIKPDKSLEDDLGGGVCQSSSTVYNAILYAGLKPVKRIHHSFPSTYVDKGLDATVNWPNVDFVFRNDRDTPVYLRFYEKNNDVFIEIYGEALPNNQEIKLETDVYKTYPAPEAEVVKDTKQAFVTYTDQSYTKVKSRPGYKVKSYRVVYQDGKEVSRELLYDDYYRPIKGLIYKGVKIRPSAPIKEEPKPSEQE